MEHILALFVIFLSAFLAAGAGKRLCISSMAEFRPSYYLATGYLLITIAVCRSTELRLMSNYLILLAFISITAFVVMPINYFFLKFIDLVYLAFKSDLKPIIQENDVVCPVGAKKGNLFASALMLFLNNCLRIWLCSLPLFLAFYCYSHLKALIPVLSITESLDPFFWFIENELFPAIAPIKLNRLVLFKLGDSILQFSYHSLTFFYSLVLGALFFSNNFKVMGRAVTALIISFFVANILYFAVPCDGPYFFKPEAFHISPDSSIEKAQQWLINKRKLFLDAPADYEVKIFNGIAGFPSMHIAQTLILIFALKAAVPRLFIPACLYELAVIIATMAFGWHYFVDDLAGVIIAIAAFKLADYLHNRLCSEKAFKTDNSEDQVKTVS